MNRLVWKECEHKMNHAESRNQLLDQVERLVRLNYTPLSQAELARRCGFHRSSISRLEQALIKRGVPLRYDDENRWYIDRNAYITFFFSSRRRHTRFKCDWSSDVCSSD